MPNLMARFSVSCSFLFPNFAPTNGKNKVPKPPRALALKRCRQVQRKNNETKQEILK